MKNLEVKKETYVSPAIKLIELDATEIIAASGYGQGEDTGGIDDN